MRSRVLVGLTLAALIIGLLVWDGYLAGQQPPDWRVGGVQLGTWVYNGLLSTTIVLVLAVLATHELVLLARARGYHPFGRTAQLFAAALVLGPYVSNNLSPLTGFYDESLGMLWLAIALAVMFLLQAVIHRTHNAIENVGTTLFIIFYAGGLSGFMTKLRMEVGGPEGVAVLLFSMFLVKMADVGAYFGGRAFGRTKMIAWLSPKKTWEGFVGGLLTTLVCAVAIGLWLNSAGLAPLGEAGVAPWLALLVLGTLLGLFSAAGDLCASLLKRDAAVKDSGQAFPGLGGVLDVLDSPLLAAPVAWLLWARTFHLAVHS